MERRRRQPLFQLRAHTHIKHTHIHTQTAQFQQAMYLMMHSLRGQKLRAFYGSLLKEICLDRNKSRNTRTTQTH